MTGDDQTPYHDGMESSRRLLPEDLESQTKTAKKPELESNATEYGVSLSTKVAALSIWFSLNLALTIQSKMLLGKVSLPLGTNGKSLMENSSHSHICSLLSILGQLLLDAILLCSGDISSRRIFPRGRTWSWWPFRHSSQSTLQYPMSPCKSIPRGSAKRLTIS